MANPSSAGDSSILRLLPSLDDLMSTEAAREVAHRSGRTRLKMLARRVMDAMRAELREAISSGVKDTSGYERADLLARLEKDLLASWRVYEMSGTRHVINATGVVIHTNLGRAPLSDKTVAAILREASGYCTLEYDVSEGTRGKRGSYAEELLAELTGAEAALIVNNCAAAAFFILTVFAKGGEVIVSRGELVEIGGDFRVPDVLTQSGSTLSEVGTTNRTKLTDYEKAFNKSTKMILRVHPSNYKIVGFTATPTIAELAAFAHKKKILLYEDAGSGALVDLSEYGLGDEPLIKRSIADGADIVSFSGDKLMGSGQAGLIVGKRSLIEKLRKHPLYRALRVGKLIYAALEQTLRSYARESAVDDIPVLKMLSMPREVVAARTKRFALKLAKERNNAGGLQIALMGGRSVIGGGSAPGVHPQTMLLSLSHENFSASELEKKLRASDPPVIARIENNAVLLDLRTVPEREQNELISVLASL
ncbi:MAG TPA: L-seryl-tRNA(Sec) selenium transferase [Pyrinomonadaceae bacterium]|nr:L-seryl-tRNA(Sec) selenium transferase [Pyrinomonadaceae bacterium]